MYGSKLITRSNFRGDPRPSLLRWRAQADRSHVERQVLSHLHSEKMTSKLLLSKIFLAVSQAWCFT